MAGLALDQAAWSSPWRGRSVRDKAVLAGGLLLVAIAAAPLPGGLAVMLICLCLLLGPIRVGWVRLARISWFPVVSILVGVATVAVSLSWGAGLQLRVTEQSLWQAAALAVRASAATLAMLVLACSTPVIDLLEGLRRARVPAPLIEIAALSYRFTFGLLDSASAIQQAQRARLGFDTRSATMRSASAGVAAIFLRAWDRARRLEEGLAGRGYDGSLRTLEPSRRRSASFLSWSLLLLVVLIGGSVLWAVPA